MEAVEFSLDYVYFEYGLSFLILGAVSYFLRKDSQAGLDWRWLSVFGFAHGLNEWLDLAALDFSDGPVFYAVRTLIMAASFAALLEFGRSSLKAQGRRAPGLWIYPALAALAAVGLYWGRPGVNAAARYAFGLTGAAVSAAAVLRAAAAGPAGLREPLAALGLALAVYAPAAGAVTPEAGLVPARWLNYASFTGLFGFPVQLLRAALAAAMAAGAWFYTVNRQRMDEGETTHAMRRSRIGWLAASSLALSLAAGWLLTSFLGERAGRDLAAYSRSSAQIVYFRMNEALLSAERAAASLAGARTVVEEFQRGGGFARSNEILDRYNSSFAFSVCYLLDRKGVTVASSNRGSPSSFVGKSYAFRPYFKEAAAGRPGTYFALGVTSGERGYYASHPVYSRSGELMGAAVVKMGLDFLEGALRHFPYSFLASPDGVAFLSGRPELLMRPLWPIAPERLAALRSGRQFGEVPDAPLLPARPLDLTVVPVGTARYLAADVPTRQPGWSVITFNSLAPVSNARFFGVLISLVLSMLLLGAFMILTQSELARETAESNLRLKEEIRTLSGILPICASCKKIRDDKGYWNRVETYVASHTRAQFSHGMCPDCIKKLYPEYSGDDGAGEGGKPQN